MYSADALRARYTLRQHGEIVAELHRWHDSIA
jgi:hypothetical protein